MELALARRETLRRLPIWRAKWDQWMAKRGFDQKKMDAVIRDWSSDNVASTREEKDVIKWATAFWDTTELWIEKVILNIMFIEGTLPCTDTHAAPLYDMSEARRRLLIDVCYKTVMISTDSQSSLRDDNYVQREYIEFQLPSVLFAQMLPQLSALPPWVGYTARRGNTVSTNAEMESLTTSTVRKSPPLGIERELILRHRAEGRFDIQVPLMYEKQDDDTWSMFTSNTILTNRLTSDSMDDEIYELFFYDYQWPSDRKTDGDLLAALNAISFD